MSYRAIDVSDCELVTPVEQPVPQLDWVPIDRLVIDETYQRPLNRHNWSAIKRIAAEFRWTAFSPVLLAPLEGGRYAVIDGQHRVHAARICRFDKVPAMIAYVPRREQAMAFAAVNARVLHVSPHQVHRAELAAGEPLAVAADRAVAEAGCRLMTYNASRATKKSREIYALSLIRRTVAAGRAEALTAALAALAAYDTSGRVALWSDFILAPWVDAVGQHRNYLRLDLAEILRENDPFRVLTYAERVARDRGDALLPAKRRAFALLLDRALLAIAA